MSVPADRPGAAGELPHESGVREALCRVGRALHRSGLVAGTAGNLSVRLEGGRVLVSPRGARTDRLTPDEVVRLSLEAPDPDALARASTEWPSHRACYGADSAVGAVVHTHAPALTAAGLRELDVGAALPELEAAVGPLVTVRFAPSGSAELAAAVGQAVRGGGRVLLLLRHGVLAVGATLDEAFDRTELAELAARAVVWSAPRAGRSR